MIVQVNPTYPPYGETELNIERIISMSPKDNRICFEYVYWLLNDEDYQKVADAWREMFR